MPDLAGMLESVLLGAPAGQVTNAFLITLFIIFLTAIYAARRASFPGFVHYAPNLLTSLGILGTFVGIVIGLLNFDVTDIDASIAPLLDGLKTAFLTSLGGMLLAICFKALDSAGVLRLKLATDSADHVGPVEIHAELQAQRQATERLAQSISGDEDSALISQIRLLRTDQKERFDAFSRDLWKKLDDFADMLSRSATEQVVNALKEVITDFNRNLTEQFGDNFKQLNAAVEELVQWQENYRNQLEHMNDQYAQGVTSITETAKSVAEIGDRSRQIPEAMEHLKTVLETAQHQMQELERHLEVFRDMRDRAVEAVPQISQTMQKMADDVAAAAKDSGEQILLATQQTHTAIVEGAKEFENRVNRTNEGLTSASDQLANNSERIREQLEATVKDINESVRSMIGEVSDRSTEIGTTLKDTNSRLADDMQRVQTQVAESISSMQQRLETALQEVFEAQTREINRTFQAAEEVLRKQVSDTGDAVGKQLGAIDEAISQEIHRSMEEMGRALAAISGRFTEDYQRLTAQMASVVEQNRQVDRGSR